MVSGMQLHIDYSVIHINNLVDSLLIFVYDPFKDTIFQMKTGACLNIKMLSYQYKDS